MARLAICCANLAVLLLALASCAQCVQPDAHITVSPQEPLGPVNRLVLGNNHVSYDPRGIFSPNSTDDYTNYGAGVWDPVHGRPVPEAVALIREMGVPIARFPGGCGVHSFDWKQTIGPVEQRPQWRFGLDEFLALCRATGSEPLITVSDYTGTAQDAADLVEYLNAPADANHPWARRRAANGHPRPYGVRWFELGNETDHGNHDLKPPRRMSAQEYGQWVVQYASAMKAVDPTVKIGALMATAKPPDDPWNHTVLPLVKDVVDFIVVHTYAVGIWGDQPDLPSDRLMRAALSAPDQFDVMLAEYRYLIRQHTGRDIPLAITEYNAAFVQDRPLPYRFTLGSALFCGDYLRVLLRPDANIALANYWQLINEYWGEIRGPVRGEDAPYVKRPAYYVHWLYNNHFGDTIVDADAQSPTFDSEGAGAVLPATGVSLHPEPEVTSPNLLTDLRGASGDGWRIVADGRAATWALARFAGDTYPLLAAIPHQPPAAYRLTGEARVEGDLGPARLGIQLGDGRGWPATHSAAAYDGLEACRDWTPFTVDYTPLPDTAEIAVNLRCEGKPAQSQGILRLRNLSLQTVSPATFPAVRMLTVNASISSDRGTLYLMVVNKSFDRDLLTDIDLGGFRPRAAHAWTLTGPAMDATNETDPLACTVSDRDVPLTSPLLVTFPARSMTALELTR